MDVSACEDVELEYYVEIWKLGSSWDDIEESSSASDKNGNAEM